MKTTTENGVVLVYEPKDELLKELKTALSNAEHSNNYEVTRYEITPLEDRFQVSTSCVNEYGSVYGNGENVVVEAYEYPLIKDIVYGELHA